jgi:protein-S-isoprenylcysteine O-methyltransferase Ste14
MTGKLKSKNPIQLLMRIPVPWMFVLTYLVGVGLEYVYPFNLPLKAPPSVSIAGGGLFAMGAVIAGWAWVIFHRAGTTRVPGQPSIILVTWGPFRMSRNPMYIGLSLAYLGEAAMLRQIWPVLVLPLMAAYLNWMVIPVEEERLREVFRDQFERYRARVRRWI